MATTYERVTFRLEGGRRKTIFLQNPQTSGIFLTGIEVNREGDEISGKSFDERRHLIDIDAIESRTKMRMDNIYGELVEEVSDQGTEPSSVAHAIINGLNGVRANRVFIDEVGEFPDAAEIYRQASQVEEWPGESYGD